MKKLQYNKLTNSKYLKILLTVADRDLSNTNNRGKMGYGSQVITHSLQSPQPLEISI